MHDWLRGMVGDVASHVAVTKSTSHEVTRYLNVKVVDSAFHECVSLWLDDLFGAHFDRFMATTITYFISQSAIAAITDQSVMILWELYRKYLKFEMGILLDIGMVELLQSQFCTDCTPPQKVAGFIGRINTNVSQ